VSTPAGATTTHPLFVPPEPPRTPKSARTRTQLLDVAARLFVEHGYDAVSIQDIAGAAGLTKGAVYGHFRSKGQLLVEVIRWRLAERDSSEHAREAIAGPSGGIELMYDETGQDVRALEVDAAVASRHDPDVAAGLRELYRERHEHIRAAAADTADPDTTAWLIEAISAGIAMKEITGLPMPDPQRLRDRLAAVFDAMT
jgi:AcrR family transcriptional regulator